MPPKKKKPKVKVKKPKPTLKQKQSQVQNITMNVAGAETKPKRKRKTQAKKAMATAQPSLSPVGVSQQETFPRYIYPTQNQPETPLVSDEDKGILALVKGEGEKYDRIRQALSQAGSEYGGGRPPSMFGSSRDADSQAGGRGQNPEQDLSGFPDEDKPHNNLEPKGTGGGGAAEEPEVSTGTPESSTGLPPVSPELSAQKKPARRTSEQKRMDDERAATLKAANKQAQVFAKEQEAQRKKIEKGKAADAKLAKSLPRMGLNAAVAEASAQASEGSELQEF